MEQNKDFNQFSTQKNSLTSICFPSQQQMQQPVTPTQYSQQQNAYPTQYPQSRSMVITHDDQQQIIDPNGNVAPFHYNLDQVPGFYPFGDTVTPSHSQQNQPQLNTYTQSAPQQQQGRHGSKAIYDTRLSDEDDERYTDAQFKMMTSKERRQLRNKLSARNFRNRRKEYITSLEEQVETFKNENSQLQLEINWVRTTMNKLQKENDDLRVKLALCQGGITTKPEPTLSDHHLSQGQSQQTSPPTATTTAVSVPPLAALATTTTTTTLPLLSDRSPSVQPISTATDTNISQAPVISSNVLTKNGNSSFTIPDLHGGSHQQQNTSPQSQQYASSPPSDHLDSAQEPSAPVSRHENDRESNFSVFAATSPSPPNTTNLGFVDATHSGSSFCYSGHLSSPTELTTSTGVWDLALPNQVPLAYPLDVTITEQLQVPSLFDNVDSFYSVESQQNPLSTSYQHLTQNQPHHVHHDQQGSSHPQLSGQPSQHNMNDNGMNNDSYVSTAVLPELDFGIALDKGQHQVNDDSILWKYPLLVPALLSIIVDHTMTMSADELFSHTRLLSTSTQLPPPLSTTPTTSNDNISDGGMKPYFGSSATMAPGLLRRPYQQDRCPLADIYPLSKKQLDDLWTPLLEQMAETQQRKTPATKNVKSEEMQLFNEEKMEGREGQHHDGDQDQVVWYDTPVTGFKAICPLYWMQRQLCRFVITYVIVKYPHLETPCKTYLPICEQFRRRLVSP
ncbi:hypothetical protein BCR42DRAFT_434481 [Absidia repens]|uniref:BZIP domain-containing protein n=1 Tax=Absidia repens TaxID=90262 RepID=A0A1X2ISS8_9FUNG|nr:hypothetical protein BCR42DRAFT_434481 [Absidia repens]